MKLKKTTLLKITLCTLAALALLATVFWSTTYHPVDIQPEPFFTSVHAPKLKPGQRVKVMSWNIQFMAGKNYVFIYDVRDHKESQHDRPSSKDIQLSLNEVARVIIDEQPDIVLLQEVDDGARRTDYQDQLKLLLDRLPPQYNNHASAFYWKSAFNPHPRVLGAVGMKLSTISKYQISDATRYQLPLIPTNFIKQNYSFKRAILETSFPIEGQAKPFVALNVHTDAFAQGFDTMEQQIAFIDNKLQRHDANNVSWCIAGDFNLLPPGQYEHLSEYFRQEYEPFSEISQLFIKYPSIPTTNDIAPENQHRWFTYHANNPRATGLDRTLDYIFYSKSLRSLQRYVRQKDTLAISDHCPIIGVFKLR